MTSYQELRKEARAFLPVSAQNGICQDPVFEQAYHDVEAKFNELVKEYPEFNDRNALKLRRAFYHILPDIIPVKFFLNSPFYFCVGINGGWAYSPARACFHGRSDAGAFYNSAVPAEDFSIYNERRSNRFILCCGPFVDAVHHLPPFTTIFQKGFKGILEETLAELEKTTDPAEREFLETAADGLKTIRVFQKKFVAEAQRILNTESLTPEQKKFMSMAAEAAERCPWEPPRTFYEGLNTLLFVREILALTDALLIYSLGRPDALLHDFYQADLAAGRITPEEAYDLISRFLIVCDSHYDGYKMVTAYGDHELEIPVTLGGCDADGKPVYNDITRFIIKAHREHDLVFPKLHCRVSKDSPEEYIRELATDTWNGRCVHTLFNDDTLIPGLIKQGKTLEEARRYICAGCWASCPDSVENIDDANYYSLARVLEAMIYQDEGQNQKYGHKFDPIDNCQSLAELRDLVTKNLTVFMAETMRLLTTYGRLYTSVCPHPTYSACLEGCIPNRKDETAGGAKYSSRIITLAFLANVVDSILAIDHVCFRKKLCTVPEFLNIVRNNWEGAEDLRQIAMKAPYWGDNKPESKELGSHIMNKLLETSKTLRNERGGEYCLSIWIYREYRYWGYAMRALPDGRRTGDHLAQALNPSDFRNKESATTTINALSCLDYTDFASSNINMTFDKNNSTIETLYAFFRTFVEMKMQLLQPNTFSREELEEAKKHPEKYHHLIVKVCGFSARFVALEPAWQDIVISRRHY